MQNEIQDLKKRVQELEQRVADLEQQSILRPQTPIHPTSVPSETHSSPLSLGSNVSIPLEQEDVDWEHLIGRVWLPRVFIVVLILGVLWGFNAAIRAGILSEPIRCILGLIATGVLLFLGERQIKKDRSALGQVLLGGGISVGVLTVFAGHMLYHLIPMPFAFVLDMILVASGVYLSHRHNSEALGVLASLGGYLVPFLLKSNHPSTLFFVTYETILSVAFLVFATRNVFSFLHYVSIGLYQIALVAFCVFDHSFVHEIVLGGVIVQYLSLVVYATIQKQTIKQPISLYTTFVVLCLWTWGLQDFQAYKTDMMLYSIVTTLLSIVMFKNKRKDLFSIAVPIATFAWALYVIAAYGEHSRMLALIVEGALSIVIAIKYRNQVQFGLGLVIYGAGCSFLFAHRIQSIASLELFGWILLLVSLYVFYLVSKQHGIPHLSEIKQGVFLFEVVLILVYLYELTQVITKDWSLDSRHLALSFVWAVYAITGILVGLRKDIRQVRLAGIVLLFVTLLKVIFVDLPEVSIAIRALLFIVLGSVGVGISRLFYGKNNAK